jgi:hypothetical protein
MQAAYVPSPYTSWTWNGDSHWTLSAPAGTTLAALTMTQSFQGFGSFYFTYDLSTPDGRLLERASTWGGGVPASGARMFVVNAPSVTDHFYCALSSCGGTGTSVVPTGLDANVEDDHAPTFDTAPSGSLLAGGRRGTKGVSFSASDVGSGISRLA